MELARQKRRGALGKERKRNQNQHVPARRNCLGQTWYVVYEGLSGESIVVSGFAFSGGGRGVTPCDIGILVPQPGIKLTPPALEGQSVNHWTVRKVLQECSLERGSRPYFRRFLLALISKEELYPKANVKSLKRFKAEE